MISRRSGPTSIRRALATQFSSKYINVIIQLVVTAVLARMLTPTEFGLVATVTVFTAFFTMLSDIGLAPAVIQYRDLTRRELSGLITFTFILGILLSVIFALLSVPIGRLYGNDQITDLCRWSSLGIFFAALGMVPNGVLLRDRQFVTIGFRLVVSTMLAGALAIALAAHGFGASALIVFNVTTSAITTLWSLVAARIPLGNLHFLTPLRRILSFAGFQAGFGIINYFSRNLDNFVVGKVLGMDALGFYDKAYKLTTYPLSYLASIVGTVLQPYLAESQDHLPYVFKQWKKTAKLLSLIGAPLAVIIVSCASEITTILYGSQWELSIPILQILGLSVYFQIVNNPTGAIFQSTNRTDLLFAHSVAATALTVSGLGIGIALGNIKAVAWGITIAYCLHTLSIAYFLIWKVFHQNIWCYFRFFLPEIAIGIPIGTLILLVGRFLTVPIVVAFIIKSCIIIVLFSLAYRFSGQWKYLLMLLKRPVKTRNSADE